MREIERRSEIEGGDKERGERGWETGRVRGGEGDTDTERDGGEEVRGGKSALVVWI